MTSYGEALEWGQLAIAEMADRPLGRNQFGRAYEMAGALPDSVALYLETELLRLLSLHTPSDALTLFTKMAGRLEVTQPPVSLDRMLVGPEEGDPGELTLRDTLPGGAPSCQADGMPIPDQDKWWSTS